MLRKPFGRWVIRLRINVGLALSTDGSQGGGDLHDKSFEDSTERCMYTNSVCMVPGKNKTELFENQLKPVNDWMNRHAVQQRMTLCKWSKGNVQMQMGWVSFGVLTAVLLPCLTSLIHLPLPHPFTALLSFNQCSCFSFISHQIPHPPPGLSVTVTLMGRMSLFQDSESLDSGMSCFWQARLIKMHEEREDVSLPF